MVTPAVWVASEMSTWTGSKRRFPFFPLNAPRLTGPSKVRYFPEISAKPPSPPSFTSFSAEIAVVRRLIAPDDNFSPFSVDVAIGVDVCSRFNSCIGRVVDLGIAALIVAADEDLSAAEISGDVKRRSIANDHFIGEKVDRSASVICIFGEEAA